MKLYNKDYPAHEDLVIVRPVELNDDVGAYCELPEYDNIRALVLSSQLPKRKSVKQIFKIGSLYTCGVSSIHEVNKEGEKKVEINLTYSRVRPEDRKKNDESYPYKNKLYRLFEDVVKYHNKFYNEKPSDEVLKIYNEKLVYNYSPDMDEKNYNNILENITSYINNIKNEVNDDFINYVLNDYNKRIEISKLRVYQDIQFTILETDSLNKLIMCLESIKNTSIECIGSPKYRILFTGYDFDNLKENATQIIDNFKEYISNYKHNLSLIDDLKVLQDKQYKLDVIRI